MQCRDAREAVQEGRRVQSSFGRFRSRDGRTGEPIADPAPVSGAPGDGGAGQRTKAEGDQFGQMSCRLEMRWT